MFARFRSPFTEFGFAAGMLYVIDRCLSGVSSQLRLFVYELMVQPIGEKPLLPSSMLRHLNSRQLDRTDAALHLIPAPPEVKNARFDQGAICLAVSYKADPLGFLWLCRDRYQEDEVRCTFVLSPAAQSVFDFDFYVLPKHRLGIGFAALWQAANQYLRERGVKYTYSRLTRFNTASRRAHEHLGWARVAPAVFLKIWFVEVLFTSIRPYLMVSVQRTRRVHIELRPDVLIARQNASQR